MRPGIRLSLLVLLGVLVAGCVNPGPELLDQELSIYRYEQEKFRREGLEERYAGERRRCDELTDRILALEEEVAGKEAVLAELESRLRELERKIAAAEAGGSED